MLKQRQKDQHHTHVTLLLCIPLLLATHTHKNSATLDSSEPPGQNKTKISLCDLILSIKICEYCLTLRWTTLGEAPGQARVPLCWTKAGPIWPKFQTCTGHHKIKKNIQTFSDPIFSSDNKSRDWTTWRIEGAPFHNFRQPVRQGGVILGSDYSNSSHIPNNVVVV